MNDFLPTVAHWWSGGDALMPVMLTVAVVLYALLAERTLVLLGVRRRQRREDLRATLGVDDPRRSAAWRTWASQYLALAEAEELARGFATIRALTTCLPLLGLLGTVTGMVHTFASLGLDQPGTVARQASAGIGLALTATQYGMALALPAVVWDGLLSRRAEALAAHREGVVREVQHEASGLRSAA